jgi:hypothetical protein
MPLSSAIAETTGPHGNRYRGCTPGIVLGTPRASSWASLGLQLQPAQPPALCTRVDRLILRGQFWRQRPDHQRGLQRRTVRRGRPELCCRPKGAGFFAVLACAVPARQYPHPPCFGGANSQNASNGRQTGFISCTFRSQNASPAGTLVLPAVRPWRSQEDASPVGPGEEDAPLAAAA